MLQPTRDQFARQVIELVRAKFPDTTIARGQQSFSVLIDGQLVPLENLYRSVVLQPDRASAYIEQWVTELLSAARKVPDDAATFEQLKERLMPVLLREDSADPVASSLVTQPLVAGLVVAYAVDSERTIWYIPQAIFQQWDIAIDVLHEAAIENLVGHSEAIAAHAVRDEDERINLIIFQTLDGFDSSRVLLPTLNARLREHLGSPFVAALPNRDILLCFRQDAQTIGRLREQIKADYLKMPHPVTDRLLLITPDGIAPLD